MLDTESDRRVAKVQIEIQAEGDDADMQIDVIGDQIIATLRNDPYLGGVKNGLVDSLRYERGQLFYDERRHVDCTCWVLDYEPATRLRPCPTMRSPTWPILSLP
ncbi:hypothetical protein U1Q18_052072, partial [Sarracenia purpurea var. burkii]